MSLLEDQWRLQLWFCRIIELAYGNGSHLTVDAENRLTDRRADPVMIAC